MGAIEKFKAAFLSKSTLADRLRQRVNAALDHLEHTRSIVESLAEAQQSQALQGLDDLESRILDQVTQGASKPGDAWVAMDVLQKEAEQKRAEFLGLSKKADKANPSTRIERSLGPTLNTLAKARGGLRAIAHADEAARLQTSVDDLAGKIKKLAGAVGPKKPATPQQCETLEGYRAAAGDLLRQVRGAQGLDPQPATQRARSKAAVVGATTIKAFGDRLESPQKDAQGRTVLQDVQGRLEVFDERFAADTAKDPQAARRNKAMRLAAITAVTADRIARDVNDPYLTPRIGQSLVSEYAPEMKDMLAADDDDEEEAKGAVRLAQALVMDDPLTKLMTGKLKPADAVQRIRDMAAVAGEEPSVMLKLLRQQFEMKIGSLSYAEVDQGRKTKDKDAKGNFELSDITGELSPEQFSGIVETTSAPGAIIGTVTQGQAKWQDDGSGLVFKPTGKQLHTVKSGDTLALLAQTYLGDAGRWKELVSENKMVQVGKTRHDLQTRGANDPLPVGAKLNVPGQMSLLDQLAPYIAAWDGADADGAKPKAESKPKAEPRSKSKSKSKSRKSKTKSAKEEKPVSVADLPRNPLKPITPDMLSKGAAKLRSPRDPDYIQAPGLGQSHAVRGPLGAEADLKPEERKKAEADKVQGQINERQYAHLRLLARGDEEDREAVLAKEGKPLGDALADKIAARYNSKTPEPGKTPRVDAAMAHKIAKAAIGWIAKVPLTVTFTADRLFSDPKKDAPTHGAQYKSDVEITRGRESVKDLIGRDSNPKVQGQVGTQGGSKTVTGWKERGDNYMRWRRDKDDREGRHDYLAPEDQQIFGAANPAFDVAKGGADGSYGANYYGSAHFLLKDAVRNRCAFIVRSAGGKTPPVQRKDLELLLYDMLTTVEGNAQFLDAMVAMAAGGKVNVPSLNWEVHLYGGFDMRKDAAEIYLPAGLDDSVKKRIEKFAQANGIICQDVGSKPVGWDAVPKQDPTKMELPDL